MDLECKIPRIKVGVKSVVKSVVLRRLRTVEELEDPEGVLPLDPLLWQQVPSIFGKCCRIGCDIKATRSWEIGRAHV